MNFNLLTTPWLEVRTATEDSASSKRITIAEIGDNELFELITPRADFKGAIYQLLIGILQSTFAPQNKKEWLQYWQTPPSQDVLQAAFSAYLPAFNLFAKPGEPAFMQDLFLPQDAKEKSIANLLIDTPGEESAKKNNDLFIKRNTVKTLSPLHAAVALYNLQINAAQGVAMGGAGHMVSIRGGGPLTTLLLPPRSAQSDQIRTDSLWRCLWLNIFTADELQVLRQQHTPRGEDEPQHISDIFPWMGATRSSENKGSGKGTGSKVFPADTNYLQIFWPMPRRIRLQSPDGPGFCDLSGKSEPQIVQNMLVKNYGCNYAGKWLHPLTPYAIESENEPISLKAKTGGIRYKNWLGLVVQNKQKKSNTNPALIVKNYRDNRYERLQRYFDSNNGSVFASWEPQLWAFGYDVHDKKLHCWYESVMPLFNLRDEQELDDIQHFAQAMIMAATDVVKTLKSALKMAWFKRPKDAKGDLAFIDANFWAATEPPFFTCLQQVLTAIRDHDDASRAAQLAHWGQILKTAAYNLFHQYAFSTLNEDGDLKKTIRALYGKGGLEHYLNASKALKNIAAERGAP